MALATMIPDRLLRLGPWLLLITVPLVIGMLVIGVSVRQGYQQFPVQSGDGPIASAALALSYGIIGAILTARLPRNAVGWLLSGVGVTAGIATFCWYYVAYAMFQNPPLLPAPGVFGWIAQAVAIPAALAMLLMALLLFPNGHLPSPSWRHLPALSLATLATYAIATTFVAGDVVQFPGVRNPFGIEVIPRSAFEVFRIGSTIIGVLLGAAAAASLIARHRAADAEARQQLRWIAFAGVVNAIGSAVMFLIFGFTRPDPLISQSGLWTMAWLVFCIGATTIPIACLFAITRYRLYAIDRIISETLVYAGLVAILAGMYAGLTELLRRAFVAVTGERSDAILVVTTLVLATTLTPVRQWLERVAAKRFHPEGPKVGESVAGGGPAVGLDPNASAGRGQLPPNVVLSPDAFEAVANRAAELAAQRVLERLAPAAQPVGGVRASEGRASEG
jgi:hypothetical protein